MDHSETSLAVIKSGLSAAMEGEESIVVVDGAALAILNAAMSQSELITLGVRSAWDGETARPRHWPYWV